MVSDIFIQYHIFCITAWPVDASCVNQVSHSATGLTDGLKCPLNIFFFRDITA